MNLDDLENDLFSANNVEARLAPILRSFAQLTSRDGFSLSAVDVAEIDAAEDRARAMVADAFAMIREQAVARRANLETFAGVEIVSIGEDCFSRSVLTRWGMKKFAKLGEKSAPFDLSVHPLAATIRLIETDFADYLDPAHLFYHDRLNYCVNRKLGVHFNHEKGLEYAEADFAALITRYQARLGQLRRVMLSDRPKAIVFHLSEPQKLGSNAEIARLWRAIVARWGGANKRMICIGTWPHGAEITPIPSPDPENIVMIDVAYPMPDYVWHMPHHCFTRAGSDFEREVIGHVKRATFPLRPADTASAA